MFSARRKKDLLGDRAVGVVVGSVGVSVGVSDGLRLSKMQDNICGTKHSSNSQCTVDVDSSGAIPSARSDVVEKRQAHHYMMEVLQMD